MAMEIVKPKLDVVFKKIFCDLENREILKCFLADIIEIPAETITDITIENTEGLPSRIDEKFVRFDMVLTTYKCQYKNATFYQMNMHIKLLSKLSTTAFMILKSSNHLHFKFITIFAHKETPLE